MLDLEVAHDLALVGGERLESSQQVRDFFVIGR